MTAGRIRSLAEIPMHAKDSEEFWLRFRDFLDGFYSTPEEAALNDEPASLATSVKHGERLDAFLAATGEHLAQQQHFRVPSWTRSPSRVLREPYFAFDTHEGRMFLLVESPTAFRARNIFVGADALSRV